jgi:hypothetical protein
MAMVFELFEIIDAGLTPETPERRLERLGTFATHDEALKGMAKRIEDHGGIDKATKRVHGFQIQFVDPEQAPPYRQLHEY